MELNAYWSAMKAGWKTILGVVVVAVAAGALVSWPQAPLYASTTRVFVAAPTGSDTLGEFYQRSAIAQQRIASYVVLATSDSVIEDVSEATGFTVGAEAIQVAAVEGTVIIDITALDADPEVARDIARAYGEVLPSSIETLEQIADTEGPQIQLSVISAANLPDVPIATPFRRNLLAALILGLGVGVGVAVLRYALDRDRGPHRQTEVSA